jgi:CPA2 family monovalent cation:H+ antiporter-2
MVLVCILIFFLSRREKIQLPFAHDDESNEDSGPLAVFAFCLAFSSTSHWRGLSPAFGAFLAGLVLGASTVRKYVLQVTLPLESILLMIFFLSIGLVIDVSFLLSKASVILGLLVLVLPMKTLLNLWALRIQDVNPKEAIVASVAMAQLGEFGFVLSAAGPKSGAISSEGYQIALSVVALSLIASPIWMSISRKIVSNPNIDGNTVRKILLSALFRK